MLAALLGITSSFFGESDRLHPCSYKSAIIATTYAIRLLSTMICVPNHTKVDHQLLVGPSVSLTESDKNLNEVNS